MAFAGNFSSSQNSNNSDVLFTDISVGSDVNLTDRRIYPYDSAGNLVLPTGVTGYVDWPISAGSTLTVANLLPKDKALTITVLWISSAPIGGSTYTATHLYGFTGYTNQFIYERVQDIAANNAIINDAQYYQSLSNLQTEVSNVGLSVTYGSISNAQAALDRARVFIVNQSKYF
jgi:hypothetical protein